MIQAESNDTWLSIKEVSELLNITTWAIKKSCHRKKYKTTFVPGNGGMQYRINLTSLPVEAQLKYFKHNNPSPFGAPADPHDKPITSTLSMKNPGDAGLNADQQKKALARAALVELYMDITEKSTGSRLEQKESFVRGYNNKAFQSLFNILGETSFQSMERWKRTYLDANKNYEALAPQYKSHGNIVPAEQSQVLLKLALCPNAPLIAEVVRAAIDVFRTRGDEHIYSTITYRRFLINWKKENGPAWDFARVGGKALNDRWLPYCERDFDAIEVGDIIILDGHTLNFEIINPFTGKLKRMTLIGVLDMKSSMMIGWEIMPTENVQAIAVAIRRAIMMLGKYPKVIYLDNGRAFGAKYFNGADLRQSGLQGLFSKFGAQVIFAWAYHAQSKTIERYFRTFSEIERMIPTYCGTSIQLQPPRMNRGEKIHTKLYQKIVDVSSFTLLTAHKAIAWWNDEYSQREQQDGHLKGQRPIDVFNMGRGEGIDKNELNYLMMSEEIKTIYRNGVKFQGRYYFAEELFGYRKEVIIKYDLIDNDVIYIYEKETGKFICEAKRSDKIHPAAGILGTEADMDKLTESLGLKKRLERSVVGDYKEFCNSEIIPSTKKQLELSGIITEENKIYSLPESNKIKKSKRTEIIELTNLTPAPAEEEELITISEVN
jgi:putative transposase